MPLTITLDVNFKVNVRITQPGIKGIPQWTNHLGSFTLAPAADGLSCFISALPGTLQSSLPSEGTVNVSAVVNVGDKFGDQNVTDSIDVTLTGTVAQPITSLGLVADAPIPLP